MNNKALRAGTYTVCVSTEERHCRDDTYMNWITFRLIRVSKGHYVVERLSNANGNGQTWEHAGRIKRYANETRFALRGTDPLTVACGTLLARHFGLSYANATVARFPKARIWSGNKTSVLQTGTQKGRKTAAPTLLGRNRDKNRNRMRERIQALDLHAAARARGYRPL